MSILKSIKSMLSSESGSDKAKFTSADFDFIAIDFETATTDRMPCQIGLVGVKNNEVVYKYDSLIKPPENRYDHRCIAVHHIVPHMTESARVFPEVWSEIKHLFEGNVVVAHNISFDLSVLDVALGFYGLKHPSFLRSRCTYTETGYKLDEAIKILKIDNNKHHDAGFDAYVCALIAIKIDTGKWRDMVREYAPFNHRKTYESYDVESKSRSKSYSKHDLSEATEDGNPFYKASICVSGTFERYPDREELLALLHRHGARIATSPSSKTTYLILGADYGPSKYAKAISLRDIGTPIEIVFEPDLYAMIDAIVAQKVAQ